MLAKYIPIFLLLLVLPLACTVDSSDVPLTRDERTMIDSIYRVRSATVKKEVDSLCDLRFERFVDHAVDSIMEERLQEIERLIKRQ